MLLKDGRRRPTGDYRVGQFLRYPPTIDDRSSALRLIVKLSDATETAVTSLTLARRYSLTLRRKNQNRRGRVVAGKVQLEAVYTHRCFCPRPGGLDEAAGGPIGAKRSITNLKGLER